MISLESQVLQRHPHFFTQQSLLFAGGIKDTFPHQVEAKKVRVWSGYFDYARQHDGVDFALTCAEKAELILFYWSKNKQEVQFQLMQLLSHADIGQQMLIVGENRCGVRSVEKMLAPYGEIAKIDSARRCGLYHFCLKNPPHFALADYWKSYQHPSLPSLTVYSLPGVFSANELDMGTDLLLATLNQPVKGHVLDLGCGAGVIGSYIKQQNPNTTVLMSDIHAMAIASAKRTLAENQLVAEVIASDVFSHIDGKFDLIISNPPFHDGIDTAYRAVGELISQAKGHLRQGGELRLVANAFLPYPDWLDRHFGCHHVLAKSNKFTVYSARL